MEKGGDPKVVVRWVLWLAAGALFIATLVIFFINYQDLQEAFIASEGVIERQAIVLTNQAKGYREARQAQKEAEKKVAEMTAQLEDANTQLSSAKGEMAAIQKMNDELRTNIEILETYKEQALGLESLVKDLKAKNLSLDADLQKVRSELAEYSADIDGVDQGRSRLKALRRQINKVKKNIAAIRRRAADARAAAQRERDRVESLYGNGGFLVRDGEDLSVTRLGQKIVDIDVKFVNP